MGKEAAQIGRAQGGDVGKARRAAIVAGQELQELPGITLIRLDGFGRQPAFPRQRGQPGLPRLLQVRFCGDKEFLHWQPAPGWTK